MEYFQWDILLGTWGPYRPCTTFWNGWASWQEGRLLDSSFDSAPVVLSRLLDFSAVSGRRAKLLLGPTLSSNAHLIWKVGHLNSLKSHTPCHVHLYSFFLGCCLMVVYQLVTVWGSLKWWEIHIQSCRSSAKVALKVRCSSTVTHCISGSKTRTKGKCELNVFPPFHLSVLFSLKGSFSILRFFICMLKCLSTLSAIWQYSSGKSIFMPGCAFQSLFLNTVPLTVSKLLLNVISSSHVVHIAMLWDGQ